MHLPSMNDDVRSPRTVCSVCPYGAHFWQSTWIARSVAVIVGTVVRGAFEDTGEHWTEGGG